MTTLSFPLSCRIFYLLLRNVGISKKGVGDEWTTLSFTFLTISNKTFHLQFENYKGSFSFQSHLKLIWMFTDYLFHLFLWRNSFERLCEQKASCISLVGENTHINSQFNPLRKSPRLVFSLALDQYFEIGHYTYLFSLDSKFCLRMKWWWVSNIRNPFRAKFRRWGVLSLSWSWKLCRSSNQYLGQSELLLQTNVSYPTMQFKQYCLVQKQLWII